MRLLESSAPIIGDLARRQMTSAKSFKSIDDLAEQTNLLR